MKKSIYILLCLLWMSCANETKSSKLEVVDEEQLEAPTRDFDMSAPIKAKESYENLAISKLKNYFDLIRLQNEHPEFREDILIQLQDLTKDGDASYNYSDIDSIQNIQQKGTTIQVNDSIQRLKLYFEKVQGSQVIPDSITAIITTKTITLDNQTVKATKVKFETP